MRSSSSELRRIEVVAEVVSFLPSVVSPLVAKAYGSGGKEAALKPIREAFFIAAIVGTLATVRIIFVNPANT